MCGIAGVFNYRSGQSVSPDLLRRMNTTLRHRGPDDEGQVAIGGAGLAMRRLSIIDVAGGHQPIANEDGRVQIVFNGEIYDYQELREGLLARGHRLTTRSDTETIVHQYEEDGAACVEKLDGMFAFALYDGREREKLLMARDRLGKKPLYYADVDGTLVFGSELKAVLQHPAVTREIDPEAVDLYLALHMIPAPFTIFRKVRKLPAGAVLECDGSGPSIRRYWQYSDFVGRERVDEKAFVAEIRALLFESVRKRLISEVPLGAFLSGGLDSSTIVAIMSRLGTKPVKTFSIGFEGPHQYNELPFARALAKHYGTEHHETVVRPDIITLLPELVHHADEPFADEASIPTYLLARAARKDVTVVLTGDGGDEVFGGYDIYLYEKWARLWRHVPRAVDGLIDAVSSRVGPRPPFRMLDRANRFAKSSRVSAAQARLGWVATWKAEERRRILSDEMNARVNGSSPVAFLAASARAGSALEQLMEIDTNVILPDEMLVKVDRMTMAASVEARCPLLDYKLVERLARVDVDQKIPGSRQKDLKHILRAAAADLVPQELLERRKHGFNVPLHHWFREGARHFVADVLDPRAVARRGIFRPDAVQEVLTAHWSGKVNAGPRIYSLLVFEMWAREFLD